MYNSRKIEQSNNFYASSRPLDEAEIGSYSSVAHKPEHGPSKVSASRVYEMVAIANACTEWIVFGQVELDKDDAATIDVMRRALLPSNACVPALPVRWCWYPDSDI
jgi:hypothetical protein